MVDGDISTYFMSSLNQLGQSFQVDLLSSETVKSVAMLTPYFSQVTEDATYDIYIGDTPFDGNYKTDNKLCASNVK